MRDGRLAQVGAPRELYLRRATAVTAEFLGDAIVLPAELGDGWARCELGRVAADTAGCPNAAEIMLRPEQVRLTEVSADVQERDPDPSACYGQVTDIEFGGAVCTVAVALLSQGQSQGGIPSGGTIGSGAPLLVKSSSIDLPPVGARVRITVVGKAHVFDTGHRVARQAPGIA